VRRRELIAAVAVVTLTSACGPSVAPSAVCGAEGERPLFSVAEHESVDPKRIDG
jgi:hypothetical protein